MKKRFLALLLTLTMVLSMGAIMVSANTETNPEGTPPAEETLPTLVAYQGSITVDGSILTDKQVESWDNEIDANAHVPLGDDVYLGLAWGSERLSRDDKEDAEKVAAAKSYLYILLYTYGQNLSKVELALAEDEFALTRGETNTLPEGVKAAFGKAKCNMGDLFNSTDDGTAQDWQEFDSAFEMAIPLTDLDFVIGETEITIPFEIKVTTDKATVEKKANVRVSAINPHYIISMVGYQCDDYTTGGSWTSGNAPEKNTFRTFLLNGWNLRVIHHKDLTANGGIQIGCNGRNTVKYGDNNFVKMQLSVNALPEGKPKENWKAWSTDVNNPARVRIVLGVNYTGNNPKKATVLDLYNGGEDGLFLYRDVGEPIVAGEPLHEASTMYIGKEVGDTFDLSLHMLPDNSLTVWVDNEEIGTFPPMDDTIFTAKSSGVGGGGYGWYIGILPGSNMATGATAHDLELDLTVVNTLEGTGAPLDLNAFYSVLDGTYNNYETALNPPSEDEDEDEDNSQVTTAPSKPNKPATTTSPAETEAPAPENGTQAPTDTEKKKGCGSSLAGGALALVATLGLAGVMLKKKR